MINKNKENHIVSEIQDILYEMDRNYPDKSQVLFSISSLIENLTDPDDAIQILNKEAFLRIEPGLIRTIKVNYGY